MIILWNEFKKNMKIIKIIFIMIKTIIIKILINIIIKIFKIINNNS